MNNLGIGDFESHCAYESTIRTTSSGSPAMGRSLLQLPMDSRDSSPECAESLNRVAQFYPLAVKVVQKGKLKLLPAAGISGLARVLAELFALADRGHLDRLKMCSSDQCHWVFFDRSKPGTRRWCSSLLCGNRQKIRDYRNRMKSARR
jgi:predicted RNA-binding Zn ribbon-like protein